MLVEPKEQIDEMSGTFKLIEETESARRDHEAQIKILSDAEFQDVASPNRLGHCVIHHVTLTAPHVVAGFEMLTGTSQGTFFWFTSSQQNQNYSV